MVYIYFFSLSKSPYARRLLQWLDRIRVFLVLTCSNPGEFLPRQYFPHTWRHKLKLSPIHTHHTNVHTPIHNGPLVLARFGSTTMIAAIQSIHQRILVLTQKGHNTSVMHTLTHPPIAHIETRLRRFTTAVAKGAKRKRRHHKHVTQNARKLQRWRPLAMHGNAPDTDTGSGVRQSANT